MSPSVRIDVDALLRAREEERLAEERVEAKAKPPSKTSSKKPISTYNVNTIITMSMVERSLLRAQYSPRCACISVTILATSLVLKLLRPLRCPLIETTQVRHEYPTLVNLGNSCK